MCCSPTGCGAIPLPTRPSGKVKYLIYQVKIIMQSFYPLMLNTAKRSRTTVEALELRGYRYAAVNKAVKKIKLASLKVTYNDGLFLAISFLVVSSPSCAPHSCKSSLAKSLQRSRRQARKN